MSWTGFNTSVSGLLASQKSLYTTNHNIANANTEGYSRQVTKQEAATPHTLPGIGMLGSGTEISEINRIRDEYTDFKYWNESAPLGEWEVKREGLVELENLFNEPSDESFRQYMDDFFSSLEDLSKNPSDYSARSSVREKAVALTKHINETGERLQDTKKELNFAIKTKVNQVNDFGHQIRALNEQIYSLELDGTKANDLRDKRSLLVDELSKVVNVQVNEHNEKYRVGIGGIALVQHTEVSALKVEEDRDNDTLKIEWGNGNELMVESGELKALKDLRFGDEINIDYRGIPYYLNKLDKFAEEMVQEFNDVHQTGYGLNAGTEVSFFDANGTEASTIKVSDKILENLDYIATADAEGEAENNSKLREMIGLREKQDFFEKGSPQGTPDDYLKSLLSVLAVDSQQADRMTNTQSAIMKNVELQRESESGVSIDEEMSNMVKYQHTYSAAARMITTIDGIYNTMINRLGLVGR